MTTFSVIFIKKLGTDGAREEHGLLLKVLANSSGTAAFE